MKIKRYLDKDMRHVLRRVREDQGPEAVILSNRRVEDGIEVIAAIDYDEALVRHALGVESDADTRISNESLASIAEDDVAPEPPPSAIPEVVSSQLQSQPVSESEQAAGGPQADRGDDVALRDMQHEISGLRDLLETQLSGLVWKDASRRYPLRAQVLRNLARLGIAPDIANIVVDRLEPINDIKNIWRRPLMTLAQTIPFADDDLLDRGGVVALIGPTGVGKTTTIAKLAVLFAMQHDPDDIALVSADAFRIGAKEHLMAFANIIGTKVYSASSSTELAETLSRLKNKKLVLIDTEGRSPRDRDLANRLAALGSNRDRVRFYLTLSAATQEAALDEAIREFNKVPLEGCIVTKIDEAAQLGCIISTLIRHDLPAAWFADGQRIPEDMHKAARKKLWLINQAVDGLESTHPRVDERTMAENYSAASAANG